MRFVLPLGIFMALVAVFAVGLTRDPKLVPSPLVDKVAPAFMLPTVEDAGRELQITDLKGQESLVNVWASWCVSCRVEHPFLIQLAESGEIPIYGLNYKDTLPEARRYLDQFGNPYSASAFDAEGKVGIDWGVYGVPETFLVDADGVIRHKHIGVLTPEVWERDLLPKVRELREKRS
jgi:cytochrome c biogenesis protein CcmG/thiol:disulfide interchange protein DsbE